MNYSLKTYSPEKNGSLSNPDGSVTAQQVYEQNKRSINQMIKQYAQKSYWQ